MPNSTDFIQLNIQYASIALIYYDYALTLGWEVQYIWGAKFRPSTLFYICARYSLFVNILFLVSIIDKTSPHCDVGYKICCVFSILGRASVIGVWTARTYVVYDNNKIILAYFSSLGLACVVLDLIDVPSASCKDTSNTASTLVAGLMCLFELSTALCTGVRTIQALLIDDPTLTHRKGLLYLLLEQGVVYFLTVTCLTIAAFILALRAHGGFFQRLLNALTLPLSGLMTAHFLLHLRRWEHKRTVFDEDNSFGPIPPSQNSRAPRSLSDFGEDPVRRAKRDVESRTYAMGKARLTDPEFHYREDDDRGEGSSSMV